MLKYTLIIFALIAMLSECSLDPFLRNSQTKNVRRFAAPAQTQRSRYQPRLRKSRIARRKYYFDPEFPPPPFQDFPGKRIKRDAIRYRNRNRNLNRHRRTQRNRSQLRRNFVEDENSFGDESNYGDANNSYGDSSSDYDYDSSYDPYNSYETYDPYSYQSSYDPYYSSYDPYSYSSDASYDPYSYTYYDPYYGYSTTSDPYYDPYQSYQDPYYGIEQNTCVCQCGQCDDAGDQMDESIQCVINTCSAAITECQSNSDCGSALTSALQGGCDKENQSCDSGTVMCGENNTECSTKWDAMVNCFGECSVNDEDDDDDDEYDTDNSGDRKYRTRTRTKSKAKANYKNRNTKAVVKTLLKRYRVATKNYI